MGAMSAVAKPCSAASSTIMAQVQYGQGAGIVCFDPLIVQLLAQRATEAPAPNSRV